MTAPFCGWGLGQTISFFDVGPRQFVTSYLTHNILTDLLLRTGLVGLLLFLAAFGPAIAPYDVHVVVLPGKFAVRD